MPRCLPLGRMMMAVLALAIATGTAQAAPPKIRTDADNTVPRCVTPKRLMAFIRTRNSSLDPRFAEIATFYKKHGEAWHVRWDYAFFQMAVETNFLSYRRGNGDWGDVDPRQNNFAGLGTTGGGVPGDSYPDVGTGVLAQIQHLVVYSGEHIDNPVGARTRLKQDDIIETMASKRGSTTFADLSRRWAADRHYGASIEWVANSYRQMYCTGPDPVEEAAATPPKPVKRPPAAKRELAQAANLGGPHPDDTPPPVRTIWSARDSGGPAEAAQAPVEPAPAAATPPATRSAHLAPMPTRKPEIAMPADSAIIAEQITQTGEEPVPVAAPAATPPTAAVPATPPRSAEAVPAASGAPAGEAPAPQSFAYAMALGAGLPKTQAAPGVAAAPGACSISSASYGGKKVLLVRADATQTRFTVLTVLEGFERSMLASYLKAHAPEGSSVGEFASKDAALAKARELCSRAAGSPPGEGASAG